MFCVEHKKKKFLPTPEYKGGPKALAAFIQSQLRYPEQEMKNKTEGVAVIRIEINHLGDVIGAKVLASLSEHCDLEAIRVAKLLKFTVAKVRNMKISFFKNINFNFKAPLQPPTTKINYTIQPKENESAKNPSNGYSYTIVINS